jgi:hypothetical protein
MLYSPTSTVHGFRCWVSSHLVPIGHIMSFPATGLPGPAVISLLVDVVNLAPDYHVGETASGLSLHQLGG